ncbi:hypothetical protein C0991_008548 [Blastosporella zonata]|nr:hypothetical protein C0991_008548 [Blastosporella zonata]
MWRSITHVPSGKNIADFTKPLSRALHGHLIQLLTISPTKNLTTSHPSSISDKYATDYFRGILKGGEKTQRVLKLTDAIIRLNPPHYSLWQYRYETLLAVGAPLNLELKLMDQLAVLYLKTYQDAPHGHKPTPELKFIAKALEDDVKIYHMWSYRQWLLAFFNELWAGELDFVVHDVRNNSAWHHPFFVVFQSELREGETDRARIVRRELTCVLDSH